MADYLFAEWLGRMPTLVVLGGGSGVGVLEGILALARQSAGGKPAYPTLFDKAAVLFRSMILDHPFLDGNKRMAVASTLVFLYTNGQIVCATDNELVRLALGVAAGARRGLDRLSKWFGSRTRPFSEIENAVRTGTVRQLVSSLPGRAQLPERPLLDLFTWMIAAGTV